MRLFLVAVCGLVAGVLAVPTTTITTTTTTTNANAATEVERHVVHEKRDRLPRNWRRSAKLMGDSVIPIRIALTQQNLHSIEDHLMDVVRVFPCQFHFFFSFFFC